MRLLRITLEGLSFLGEITESHIAEVKEHFFWVKSYLPEVNLGVLAFYESRPFSQVEVEISVFT